MVSTPSKILKSKILQSLIDSARLLSTAYRWVHPYVLLLEICHKTKTICLTCQTADLLGYGQGTSLGPVMLCHITILRLWRLENLSSYVS